MPSSSTAIPALTARQREVVALIAEGRTMGPAARSLGLATGTIELHLFCARRKTGCKNERRINRAWPVRPG